MAGYREITVAGGEGRSRRPAGAGAAATGRRTATVSRGNWRVIAARGLSYGLSEGTMLCRERPGTVFGAVVALCASGFICFNALGHQTGRHPAPILPKVAARISAPAKTAAEPAPVAKDAPRDVAAEPVKAMAPVAPPAAPKQASRDPIADLIRAEDTTASVTPKAKPPLPAKTEAPAPADPAVMKVQRALGKLGYGPVKADGAMGPATKAAIEKFERDRKLPVTGEAAGRTLRALESHAAKG